MSISGEVEKAYTHISFIRLKEKPKTNVWGCYNNSSCDLDLIGEVYWHGPWRQYVYLSAPQIIYSTGCLADIREFIAYADSLRSVHKGD